MTKFYFDTTEDSQKKIHIVTSKAVMSKMRSQILKFVDSPKTQKPKYPENETFF